MQSILQENNAIFDMVGDFFGPSADKKEKDNFLGGSISKYVKDLVMTFPTMFDTSLSPSTAGMISKANERNIVTMLTLLFASMQIDAKSGREAIQKVHNNINTQSASLYDIYDALTTNESGNVVNGVRISDVLNEMVMYLKTHTDKVYPTNSLNEKSLMNYTVMKDYYGRTVVREADIVTAEQRDKAAAEAELARQKTESEEDKAKREKIKFRRDEQLASLPRVMSDQDYRKANELAPTLLLVTFNEVDGAGNHVGKTTFAAGVKSRLVPVDSSDIIDRLAEKKKTALSFTNFIRATTGEISFVKDFLFCVSQAKIRAKNDAKKGPIARMWRVLDSRQVKGKYNKLKKSGNDASAITTLVINQETANMLKKEYNYNIEDFKVAKYIMEEYNLLGIIICDESIEVAKILYHGNDGYEQVPYSFLNRENNDAKAYKDMINLFNQTRR